MVFVDIVLKFYAKLLTCYRTVAIFLNVRVIADFWLMWYVILVRM